MAAERSNSDEQVLVLHPDQPLIGVVTKLNDQYIEQMFTSEEDAEIVVDDEVIRSALALAGAWSDLDWDDMVAALDRIRHSNPPSPPIAV